MQISVEHCDKYVPLPCVWVILPAICEQAHDYQPTRANFICISNETINGKLEGRIRRLFKQTAVDLLTSECSWLCDWSQQNISQASNEARSKNNVTPLDINKRMIMIRSSSFLLIAATTTTTDPDPVRGKEHTDQETEAKDKLCLARNIMNVPRHSSIQLLKYVSKLPTPPVPSKKLVVWRSIITAACSPKVNLLCQLLVKERGPHHCYSHPGGRLQYRSFW